MKRTLPYSLKLCVLMSAMIWKGSICAYGEQSLNKFLTDQEIAQVEYDWAMNCQGCHGTKGEGSALREVPPLLGEVSKFFLHEDGREFLIRVPGVSGAPLKNNALTDVLNWMVLTMDPENIPEGWKPFMSEEVGELRLTPLRANTFIERARILSEIE